MYPVCARAPDIPPTTSRWGGFYGCLPDNVRVEGGGVDDTVETVKGVTGEYHTALTDLHVRPVPSHEGRPESRVSPHPRSKCLGRQKNPRGKGLGDRRTRRVLTTDKSGLTAAWGAS